MMNHRYTLPDMFAVARNEPEINNLLNTDVYKFLMLDFILAHPEYRDIHMKWGMTVRSHDIKTANVIPQDQLVKQFDMTRSIAGVQDSDLSYLRGMRQPNRSPLFREETLTFLKNFRLPEYSMRTREDGNYELEFEGSWADTTLWEIYALKIVNTLYLYNYLKRNNTTTAEFDRIITTMKDRINQDIDIALRAPSGFTFSDFGTRRSLSTDYQAMVLSNLTESLPTIFRGASNVLLARNLGGANPTGTNAHELRMVPTALYDDPDEIVAANYRIDQEWAEHYPGLSILLPDTYGSSFYFKHASKQVLDEHNGCRIDSKGLSIAIPEYVNWVLQNGGDLSNKIVIASDGLTMQKARDAYEQFGNYGGLGGLTFGIGTNLTNNSKNTLIRENSGLGAFGSFSVVIKPIAVRREDGTLVSCVKLSDNESKVIGERERVQFFQKIFGREGVTSHEVSV